MMVFHIRRRPASRADSRSGAEPQEDGGSRRRSIADGFVDRLSRLSKDMVESVRIGFACAPKMPVPRRSHRRGDSFVSIDAPSFASEIEGSPRHDTNLARRFSMDSRQQRKTWRSAHGSIREWQGFPLRKQVNYKYDDLVIGEMIGRGEHGTVYIAKAGTHVVAVKIAVDTDNSSKAHEKGYSPPEEMFTGVHHPNLVQVYGVHKVEKNVDAGIDYSSSDSESSLGSGIFSSRPGYLNTPCYQRKDIRCTQTVVVMEYCDKGDLWSAVKLGKFHIGANRTLPNYRKILEVALEVAYGMQHLHELGIIHGDLKAKNILIFGAATSRKKFIAKISDFGRSRRPQHGRQDITTYSSGTVDHMAPETLKDGKLHRATDVFSFSILLYEMITRKHPFGSMEPAGILVAIVEGMRPRIPYNCPPEIARMMKACWHHNWQSRPSFGIIVARLINIMTRPINAGR